MNGFKEYVLPVLRFLLGSGTEEPPRQLHILIVEDNARDSDLMLHGLKKHRVSLAESFDEAEARLDEMESLDAAYVDLNIPGGHGVDICNRISVSFPTARVAIVCGASKDLDALKPGDCVMVMIKSARMAQDIKRHAEAVNGNGNNASRPDLVLVIVTCVVMTWMICCYRMEIIKWLKEINP